jgi:hypothetical protein
MEPFNHNFDYHLNPSPTKWERARVRETYFGALILTFSQREKEKRTTTTQNLS